MRKCLKVYKFNMIFSKYYNFKNNIKIGRFFIFTKNILSQLNFIKYFKKSKSKKGFYCEYYI